MLHRLVPHPDSPAPAIRIAAEAVRIGPGALRLLYAIEGEVEALALPSAGPAVRRDGLWQHSCLEAFVMAGEGPGYYEVNLAPSGAWAAYAFSGYRDGMAEALGAPQVRMSAGPGRFELDALVEGLPADAAWRVGLSAVIEAKGGSKSWWALAHPPGKADFHHPSAFLLTLPSQS